MVVAFFMSGTAARKRFKSPVRSEVFELLVADVTIQMSEMPMPFQEITNAGHDSVSRLVADRSICLATAMPQRGRYSSQGSVQMLRLLGQQSRA